MVSESEVRQELFKYYPDIGEDSYLDDYVRIGHFLSKGIGDQGLKNSLRALDQALVEEIRGAVPVVDDKSSPKKGFASDDEARQAAIAYFRQRKDTRGTASPKAKEAVFSHLLARVLGRLEIQYGFKVSVKAPIYAYLIDKQVFLNALKDKEHFKDVGALATHGEFTHRLQWYLIVNTDGVIQTVKNKSEKAYVFGAMGYYPVPDGMDMGLWNLLVDRLGKLPDDDFRRPENLNNFLTAPIAANYCPVLSSILSDRKYKRGNLRLHEIDTKYVQKKPNLQAAPDEIANAAIYKYDPVAKKYKPVPDSRGS
jgi:hypothetical protein